MELRRGTPLYDKKLSFLVERENSAFEPVDVFLVFRILQGSQPSAPGQNDNIYYFELSDERDSYFLYTFVVSEASFPIYKRDQSILVDFHDFPAHIIELLEVCINRPTRGSSSPSKDSTFTAKFSLDTGILSFIESTKFKQVKHIELPMQVGDDAAIKAYLASRLALSLKSEHEQSLKLVDLMKKVDQLSLELADSEKKLFQLETRMDANIQDIKGKHAQEINQLNERHLFETRQMHAESSQAIEELKVTINNLKNDNTELKKTSEKEAIELTKTIHQLEAQVNEHARNLTLCRNDRDRFESESDDHLQKLAVVEKEKSDLQVDYMKLESKYRLLEQKYEDQEETVRKMVELQKSMEENKKALEQHIQYANQQQQELQQQHQQTKDELQATVQQFEVLKNEYNRVKEMILKKNEVIRKQEALVVEIRQKTGDYEGLYKKEVEKSESQSKLITSLKKELKEITLQFKESNIQVEKMKKMTEYLSQELLQTQHGFPLSAGSDRGGYIGNPFSSPMNYQALKSTMDVAQPQNSSLKTPTVAYQGPQPDSDLTGKTVAGTTNVTTPAAAFSSIPSKYHVSSTLTSRPSKVSPSETKYSSSYFPQSSSSKKILQGVQSLGLAEHELNVNLDELNDSNDFSSSAGISSFQMKQNRVPSNTKAPNDDISLEDIDFYATKR